MKQNNFSINGNTHKSITIEFSHLTAEKVNIAGSFNDWRPEATQMIPLGDGRWRKKLVLPPGAHEYLFVADGEWIADPSAGESVRNQFGSMNSVLRV